MRRIVGVSRLGLTTQGLGWSTVGRICVGVRHRPQRYHGAGSAPRASPLHGHRRNTRLHFTAESRHARTVLGDPKRLRTRRGYGFLCSWKDKFRFQDREDALAMVEQLLDDPENVAALREQYGNVDRSDLEQRLVDQLVGGWSALVRTRPRFRPLTDVGDTEVINGGGDRPPGPRGPKQQHALRLRFPAAPEHAVELLCAGKTSTATTNAAGVVAFDIPEDARSVRVRVIDREEEFQLDLSRLDDASTRSGAATRLRNLGFLGEARGRRRGDPVARALRLFQVTYGLAVTGELDPATVSALRETYGC